ncbi:DUF3109 family protein [Rufibacter glacialis]|uniref:DUF3109 family protein n=1 Tax=Rufibacter glacialis TaxID=1259555 RepID=A0A5M8QHP5_9BACT|nr:DUF3109 family protein [Rufibacter glacialis]KAA6434671.1 DUF3109 family protein [Rufibacter glacialis]GGK71496.1 hypothetical protein GCM10011405_19600 [Rufibacter glacialis]
MIVLQNTVLSDDLKEKFFVCNLEKCKGACCVEGDLGAPLEQDELPILAEVYAYVKPYMSAEGVAAVEAQGLFVEEFNGDFSTTTIGNRECAYAIYDENLTLKCAIEAAYLDGKISWKKPISCHLYPIRITKYDGFEALNYDRWEICNPACSFGQELGVPVYKFLREPLIRRYGQEWFQELEELVTNEALVK